MLLWIEVCHELLPVLGQCFQISGVEAHYTLDITHYALCVTHWALCITQRVGHSSGGRALCCKGLDSPPWRIDLHRSWRIDLHPPCKLLYPNNIERQARKWQVSFLKSLIWLDQVSTLCALGWTRDLWIPRSSKMGDWYVTHSATPTGLGEVLERP